VQLDSHIRSKSGGEREVSGIENWRLPDMWRHIMRPKRVPMIPLENNLCMRPDDRPEGKGRNPVARENVTG
jgi:hypothetical protein